MSNLNIDILAIGAHPDDVELGCGGTIIKEVQNGKRVGIIDLTRGELGTRGTARTRNMETKEATTIMGVLFRENMNFKDGFFKDDEPHKIALIKKIRQYRPKIVITNAVSDRHPDHPRSSQITIDACFLSGLEKSQDKRSNSHIEMSSSNLHYCFDNLWGCGTLSINARFQEGKNNLKDYKNIKWVNAKAESLPVKDNVYDFYSISYGIRNVTDINKSLREAYRVLKPGGRFMCLEFSKIDNEVLNFFYKNYSKTIPIIGKYVVGSSKPYDYLVRSIKEFYDQKQLLEFLVKNGFSNVEYRNLSNGVSAIHSGWKV